ncbi:MAG: hypothetical protein VX815_06345 [Gemmatimonadota bacterium]|nr:hypothetical protein [Gemmatimonadota bacterium]
MWDEAALAPLAARFEAEGYADPHTVGVLEYDSPWNWKVLVDNFMESDHHLGRMRRACSCRTMGR